MKVASIHLQDFKRFENLEIKLRNSLTGDIADRFLLLGDNGTGKTTVLQAIALCLSLASRRTRSVRDFHWLGWVSGRYERWGRPVVELEVHFSQEEIDATREAASRWFRSRSTGEGSPSYVEPGDSKVVSLRLDGEYYSAGSQAELYQFRGAGTRCSSSRPIRLPAICSSTCRESSGSTSSEISQLLPA